MEQEIIITGASGFVGQNLMPYLEKLGGKVAGVSLRQGVPDILPVAGVFVHLAGKAHDLKKTSNDQEYFDINYGLTKQLYDRFLKSPDAEVFIFISSVKAAADEVEGVLKEEVVCNPATPYGKSKRQAEEYILSHLPVDKKVYILRPCMIHGPGNKGNLNLLYSFAKKGLPFPLAAFENQRSFLSVDNLSYVIGKLADGTAPSGIYHVADDGAFSTNELIRLMARSLDRQPRLWKVPAALIRGMAKVGDKFKLPLNSERLQKLTESYIVSNAKIKEALGTELPVSGEEGLMRTFESFK